MNRQLKFILICLSIIAVTAIYTGIVYSSLPAQIPVHFNIAGEADRYENKETGGFFVIWLMLGMTILFSVLPALSPKSKSIDSFRSTYELIIYGLLGFMAVMQVAMLNASSQQFNMSLWVTVAMCGLFAFLGNLMGKVTPNYYVGIRTPWTLESDTVWERTHRLAAKLMVFSSIGGIIAALLGAPMAVVICVVLLAILIPVPYSYWLYRELKLNKSNPTLE